MSAQFETLCVAYHEAGHTVCGLLMFMKIDSVSVYKDKITSGLTNYYHISESQSDSLELNNFINISNIYFSYAGLAAEKILYKDITGSSIFPRVLKEGTGEDINKVAEIIKLNNLASPGKKRYLFKKKMMRDVTNLLIQHWDIVKIVAHELFEKKKLSYEDLKKIIYKKTSNKKFWKKRFDYINKFVVQEKILDAKDLKIILNT